MKNQGRREFLRHAGRFAAFSLLDWPSLAFARTLASAGSKGHRVLAGSLGMIYSIDAETHEVHSVALPSETMPHSFIPHPLNEAEFWTVEKSGSNAVAVNFREGKVTHALRAPEGTLFYGHGFFSSDGKVLFFSRVDTRTGRGHLVGYDAHNYKQTIDCPVAVGAIHECRQLPDRTFLVTSAGVKILGNNPKGGGMVMAPRIEKSSLLHVDLKDGKVLDRRILEDEGQNVGHFAFTSSGTIVVATVQVVGSIVGDPKQGRGTVQIAFPGKPFKKVEFPPEIENRLKGEMLSISLDEEHHRVCVTNPAGSIVLFVDTNDASYIGHIDLQANGVARMPNGDKFVFSPLTGEARLTLEGVPLGAMEPFPLKIRAGDSVNFFSSHILVT